MKNVEGAFAAALSDGDIAKRIASDARARSKAMRAPGEIGRFKKVIGGG